MSERTRGDGGAGTTGDEKALRQNGSGNGAGVAESAGDIGPSTAGDGDGASAEEKTRERVEPDAAEGSTGVATALKQLGSIASMIGYAASEQLRNRIPKADLDERDPDYIREQLPGLWMLASFYYRAEVRGLENIPASGPVLLVGNHTGGNTSPEVMVFPLAFQTYFGVERRFYQLAHNLVLAMPGLSRLRKFGTVAASRDNAHKALDAGAALLVFPGGDYEVHRPSWEGNKVDFGGRTGFIRLALERDVPIVPLVTIGGQETALFLSRGERLAKLLQVDKTLRLKVMPISLALPWIINVGDLAGHLPLPAKITIEALEPIDLRETYGEDPDLELVYDDITSRMQRTLDALAGERRFPVIG